jgi:hypothetical protein
VTTRFRRSFVALVTVTACITTVTAIAASGAGAARRLPPPDRDDLARIFDPMLEDLGLRTTRARLQNLRTYETDPNGRHLAIYVEPIDESYTDAEYIENFTETAKIFLPLVYKRWRGLKSFDVCQEPRSSEDSREEPPARTQLLVTRAGAKDVRWRTVTLVTLLTEALEHRSDRSSEFTVYFEESLATQRELAEARFIASAKSES